jgi:hypothetical protein
VGGAVVVCLSHTDTLYFFPLQQNFDICQHKQSTATQIACILFYRKLKSLQCTNKSNS